MAGTEPAFSQHYGAIEHTICHAANHHNQAPLASEGDIDVIPVVPRYFAPSQTEYRDESHSDFNAEVPQATNNVTEQDEHTSASTPVGELVRWHHRLGHMSFKKFQLLNMMNLIPRELSKCKAPMCVTCMYGEEKVTRGKSERQLSLANVRAWISCSPVIKVL